MLRLVLLIVSAAVAGSFAPAAWSCPSTSAVPPQFIGAFGLAGGRIGVTADAVLTIKAGDAVASSACVVHTFVNPNSASQAFITFGDASNFANDTETGCAFVDTGAAASVVWSASTNESDCPLDPTGAKGGAWSAGAPAPAAACPARGAGAQVPAALRGRGALPDADGTADSLLVISASQFANVTAGAFVDPGCVAAVADAGPAGVTALSLSLRADGKAQACVWARPGADGQTLEVKRGAGAKCPTNFDGPQVIHFTFASGR